MDILQKHVPLLAQRKKIILRFLDIVWCVFVIFYGVCPLSFVCFIFWKVKVELGVSNMFQQFLSASGVVG